MAAGGIDLVALRHDLHRHPELQFEETRTSGIVARELAAAGFQVATGIARTGVVGTLSKGQGRRVMGVRADMDALPIHETTNLAYASATPGKMHACGHDGHTTMLIGLARRLATMDFDGTVHLIFQPAEEGEGGARHMVEEGLFRRFPCDGVFALHNLPGVAPGQVMVRGGPITAAVDVLNVTIHGVAGHGAIPHRAVDPVVAAAAAVMALQTAVSRNLDPLDPAVVTVGAIHGGVMATAIPDQVALKIGLRTVTPEVRALMKGRIAAILLGQAESLGCRAEIDWGEGGDYPPGFNDPALAALVREAALELGQEAGAVDMRGPFMFSEDFAFMQQVVPACYFGLGNGDSRALHDPGYDFNDRLLELGPAFWARLVQKFLPVK
ncbi:MAG TPA: amidohydrolase [Aestuariivirga sp.]|mgnify:CR=1 FL=1|nr:amidohydrolase [Aestuariivirga sp.]